MQKAPNFRTRKIFVLPIHDEDLPNQKSVKLKNSSVPKKRLSIYGIHEGNTVEGKNCCESLRFLVDRYGQNTTVPALKRICQRRTGFKERIVWSFGFLVALYLLTSMYANFANRYRRKQLQTTVNNTFFPVYKLPFPEVVICNNNRFNWARLNESMAMFLAPEHRTTEYERLFSNIIARYKSATLNTMFEFHGLAEEPLKNLNYINFTNVVDFMSWRCDEILRDCKWRSKSVNCCDVFFPRRTSLGQCLSFNSVLSKEGHEKKLLDPFWPWRYGHYERGSGLQLRVVLGDEVHQSFNNINSGVVFMTVDPGVYSDYVYTPVRANNTAYIAIWGSVSYLEDLAQSLPLKVRGCVFPGEMTSLKTLHGLMYQQENCLHECQQRQMIQACNCTVDLFFPAGVHSVCQLVDLPCLAKHWVDFAYSEALGDAGEGQDFSNFNSTDSSCNCYFSCHSMLLQNYIVIEQKPLHKVSQGTGSYVDLDFYWGRDYVIIYKTSLVYSWVDLLVSFGGIASLLLGCSLISIVELLVFLLLETPDFIRKKRRSEMRLRALQEKQNVENLINYDRTH